MIPHWTDSREALRLQLARASLLVASDFDGTLSDIVPQPEDARLRPGAAEVLESLARCPGTHVAVVSGRALDDLARRVPVGGVTLIGNHGLEQSGPRGSVMNAHAERLVPLIGETARRLTEELRCFPGVVVEDKRLTATVHFRNAPPKLAIPIARIVENLIRTQPALELHTGKMALEIWPRLEWDKGDAIRALLVRLHLPEAGVVVLGDDVTDESAFRALPAAVSVHVGRSPETAAHLYANDPQDAVAFLRWLAGIRKSADTP